MHQEQLDGAMNIRDKYGKIGADNEQYVSYEQIAKFILQHTENHLAQQREIFRRIIYAYLLEIMIFTYAIFSFIYPKTVIQNLLQFMILCQCRPILKYLIQHYLLCHC